jgi:hypothetical protein
MERNSTADGKALVHTHVPVAVRDEFRAIALHNHRSIAGELRHVISEHVERERSAGKGDG